MMEKQIMPDKTPQTRLEYLETMADEVTQEKYYVGLTQDEITERKSEFTNNALAIDDLEEQKKDVIKEFKENLTPLKKKHKELGAEIRTGYTKREGLLYKFVDQASRMVHYYDNNGTMIESRTRPATADEVSQTTIQMRLREGTNN